MTDQLNPAQLDAVRTLSGPLLVLAGAGTGKTRVITHRMAELIRSGVAADRILSVTFTNKAAKEMAERMQSLLGRRLRAKPWLSTFHAYCVRVLREEITSLGYPAEFVIYDRGDQESAARRALRDLRMTDAAMRPGDLVNAISRWKTNGIRPGQASELAEDSREQLAAMGYRRYQLQLKATGAVDFDDILLLTEQLFAEFPDALARQQQRFDHVQIDEYQDTNELQFRLIEALVRRHRNLCVVGDDDQSIYGFRGAEVRHILGFQEQFPEAKVVRLEDNYRCTEPIIRLANELVRFNRGRHEKRLIAHRPGQAVVFREFEDEQAEAEGVVREIRYLVEQLKVTAGDIAILFRTNEQPRMFETEMRRVKVPYRLVGGQSFFERKETKDLQAFLRLLTNPLDEVSLLRVINVPARGIGDKSVEKVLTRAVKQKMPFWEMVQPAAAEKEITAKTAAAMHQFHDQLERCRERLAAPAVSMAQVVRDFLDEIDYASEVRKQYPDAGQQDLRLTMVDEFVDSIATYQQRATRPSLADFIAETTLDDWDNKKEEDPELSRRSVCLMTLHSAKGLEFPRVFLVGLEEGILPHRRSVDEEGDNPGSIEEERRLCYVGITRARDYLTISRAKGRTKWGRKRDAVPSRFLAEMTGQAAKSLVQDDADEETDAMASPAGHR